MARPRLPRSKPGDQPVGPQQIVERAINQTRPGWDEHQNRIRRFNSSYDIWRGNTTSPQGRRPADWQSRLRVKIGMQIVDQALVNIAQGVPNAKVTPRQPGKEQEAEAFGHLLNYYGDQDHLAEKEPLIDQMALVYGIAPAKMHWLYCEQAQTSFAAQTDPDTGQTTWAPKKGNVVTADRPTMEPWDPYAIWWDPLARDVETSRYIVLESWLTRDQLEEGRWNDQDGTGKWKNLDALYQLGDGGQPNPTSQNQMMTQPQGSYRGRFRIWEIWRKTADGMRLTVVGNQKIMLSDGPSPYWMTQYPITISNSRPDLFRIEGISELELIDHIQQAFWTVHNLRMEQLKFSIMQGATIRQTAGDIASFVMRPAFQWLVQDHDDVMFHSPPPLQPEAYKETETLISLGQYITGINAYVSGTPNQGADNTTATGVSLLTESASRLLQFKARVITQKTWQRGFEQWGDLCGQFVRRDQQVRVVGPGGIPDWVTVGPAEVNGDYDIRIEAGDESASRAQERSDAIALWNALLQGIIAGRVDPKVPLEKLAKAFNLQNPEALIPVAPAPPPNAAPNGGQPDPFTLGQNGGALGNQHLPLNPAGNVLYGNQ